jgi:hypothetical protein
MQIIGQNTIVGRLPLELNDPYLRAVRHITIAAGESVSVDSSMRYSQSVLDAIFSGLVIISPEQSDNASHEDIRNVDPHMIKVDGAVSGGALASYVPAWDSTEVGQFPNAEFLNLCVFVSNDDPSDRIVVKITTPQFFGSDEVVEDTIEGLGTRKYPVGYCNSILIEVKREIAGTPPYRLRIRGYAALPY